MMMKRLIIGMIFCVMIAGMTQVQAADKIDTKLIKEFINLHATAIMQKDEPSLMALIAEDYRKLQ